MRVALGQINSTVGDLKGNVLKIKEFIESAKGQGAHVIVFPELAITGYPPEDLLHKPRFIKENIRELKELAGAVEGITAIVGFVDKKGKDLLNAAAVIENKKIKHIYHKILLPNYQVFDEKRYFKAGNAPLVFKIKGINVGVAICEDIWFSEAPIKYEAKKGAKIIFALNASPYFTQRINIREEVLKTRVKESKVNIVYVNLTGGQDELVFDGYSMVMDNKGKIIALAPAFKEELMIVDIPVTKKDETPVFKNRIEKLERVEEIYNALVMGLKDYAQKNGFKKVVLGLSGGVDSALVAALAVDALGKENVTGVFMPSQYSSRASKEDAYELAKNLDVKILNIPIKGVFDAYLKFLKPVFTGFKPDIAEENIQARIRGNLLMALSNKFNWLVLTTGNKSEMSTGYGTLYGDMAGGFAVIKDVPKMVVYELCRFRNSPVPVISKRVMTKAPTAELKPNQKDSDSLPVYPVLDPILRLYIEEDKDAGEIISRGFKKEIVYKTMNLVDRSEFKRRQSPPGVKISQKAFGKDRRMPITNKFRMF